MLRQWPWTSQRPCLKSRLLIATRTRQHVFDDLTPLMPLVGRLGGAPALDGASAAVAQIVQRWP